MLGIIDLVGWIIAIVTAVFGVLGWISMFTDKNGIHIFMGVIAAIVAVIIFSRVYDWLESIGFALFCTGAALCAFAGASSNTPSSGSGYSKPQETGYTFGKALTETLSEYELAKAAAKDAYREMKE